MAEQASSVEGDFRQVRGKVGKPEQTSLRIARGHSPKGYDLVIGSYDATYSGSGALHQYIARELGLDDVEPEILLSDDGFRILSFLPPSSDFPIFLGQVISIYDAKDVARRLQSNLGALLRHLNQTDGVFTKVSGSAPRSMWIPTIGTGSAGLSHEQSAQVIAAAFEEGFTSPNLSGQIKDITIAPPKDVSEADYQDIVQVFSGWPARSSDTNTSKVEGTESSDSESQTISEMPDQFHSDHALEDVSQDDLGRDAIAETIATNVSRVWREQERLKRPFAIHLSGRWGSGKSSILGFLGAKLAADTTHHPDGWVVVNYNAWRMQEAGPPWWSLLTTVREQGYAALGTAGYWPRFTDWLWRNTRIAWPWIVTLIALFFLITVFQMMQGDGKTVTLTVNETIESTDDRTAVRETVTPEEEPNSLFGSGNAWNFVLTVIAGLGSMGAMAKLIQGWNRSASETAEAVRELQSDPTAAVKARFERVIANIDRPVVVFIDDLDRCDARFVVELMQSLQTAYSRVAVLYVVASDRDWIVSAYNQVYDGFQSELSKPGAPLGYLFVKKIFQLSVPVPDLAGSDRTRLAQALLRTGKEDKVETVTRAERASKIRDAAAEGDLNRVTEIQSAALAEGQNLASEVMQAVSDPANQQRLRHKLLEYTEHFDGNPRAIKRLINALTFRQGYILTAAEDIPFDHIARWTILTLRFPYTADFLADRPSGTVPDDPAPEFPDPAAIRAILGDLTPEDIGKVAAFG